MSRIGLAVKPQSQASQLLTDHYRCPDEFVDLAVEDAPSSTTGYFQFGVDTICYGQCASGAPQEHVTGVLHDALPHASSKGPSVRLSFDPVQVVDNLRHERYAAHERHGNPANEAHSLVRRLYYLVRPLMHVGLRKYFQKLYLHDWKKIAFPHWPVDSTVENLTERLLILSMKSRNVSEIPFIWFWPNGAPTCTAVTHDVEAPAGLDFCPHLMDMDDSYGIKSAFQIVPEERYPVVYEQLVEMRERGFEVNLHDLNHDGNLITDRDEFLRRARLINEHGRKFETRGFRAGVLYRNLDWYRELDFSYEMSVPNVAHLEPQRGGCCTVFPFFNGRMIELPVTMSQDYSLFNILNDYSINIWKEQIALIRRKHGLMQMIVHPDYIQEDAARRVYGQLLAYLAELRATGQTWIALPGEAADWWRLRSKMRLVRSRGSWQIEGEGRERAQIAYAKIADGEIAYEFNTARESATA